MVLEPKSEKNKKEERTVACNGVYFQVGLASSRDSFKP